MWRSHAELFPCSDCQLICVGWEGLVPRGGRGDEGPGVSVDVGDQVIGLAGVGGVG